MAGYAESPRSPFFMMPNRIVRPPVNEQQFRSSCRRCSRLAAFLDAVRLEEPGYYCRPVPPFGDAEARLLIVGLAPGMHGANRTGRPFTGDMPASCSTQTLHKFGLRQRARFLSAADDGLQLAGRPHHQLGEVPAARRTSRCRRRSSTCNDFLRAELAHSPEVRVILALGAIAHGAVLRACDLHARDTSALRTRAEHHLLGGPRVARLVSLQPLQHPDAAPHDRADVRERRGVVPASWRP